MKKKPGKFKELDELWWVGISLFGVLFILWVIGYLSQ